MIFATRITNCSMDILKLYTLFLCENTCASGWHIIQFLRCEIRIGTLKDLHYYGIYQNISKVNSIICTQAHSIHTFNNTKIVFWIEKHQQTALNKCWRQQHLYQNGQVMAKKNSVVNEETGLKTSHWSPSTDTNLSKSHLFHSAWNIQWYEPEVLKFFCTELKFCCTKF